MLIVTVSLSALAQPAGTAAQRDQLFDEIRAKVMAREAFSPVKEQRLGLDVGAAMDALRPEISAASDETDLFYALVKLSNARKDRHLDVYPARGGLDPEFAGEASAPLRFATDYGTPGAFGVFVTDADPAFFSGRVPAPGDRVVSVDGQPLDDYVAAIEPYYRYSTVENLWWHVSQELGLRGYLLPPDHYTDEISYGLQASDGTSYEVTVPWVDPDTVAWTRSTDPAYPDMALELTTTTFELYRHTAGRDVVLLRWFGFKETLLDDVDRLVRYARDHGLLDHALVIDATGSRGGSHGAEALSHLTPEPFRCTFGNLRLSDVTVPFIEEVRRDEGSGELLAWLEGPVTDALSLGEDYSEDVPFKLQALPADSDGIVQPAPLHFRGQLVAFFGPGGGSHLDQFAAMIVDNDLGHTIGMSTGGYSNTWEWTEELTLPGTDQPLANFMWSIGHTIRPNGEILEGNPARVDEWLPLTADNHATYHAQLLERAYAHLSARSRPTGPGCRRR